MDAFGGYFDFAKYVVDQSPADLFTLVDVGCSGGIDPRWRFLGDRLQAFCFDPNLNEIERLRQAETRPQVQYFTGFVTAPADHPFLRSKDGGPNVSRNPWNRLAVEATRAQQAQAVAQASYQEKTERNEWAQTELVNEPIILADFIRQNNIRSIDFIKIDVDGKDFEILHSLADAIDEAEILAFGVEVNYIGSDGPTEHTYHNTDRFMRAHNYDLCYLDIWKYSMRHMPGKYLYWAPARSSFGRPLQGDAIYMRDICAEYNRDFAIRLGATKKLKLAVLYSLFSLPDCAAEILQTFASELTPMIGIDRALDLLAVQAQQLSGIADPQGGYMSYQEYIKSFNNNSPIFYLKR